jgi:hypothetical protein
MLQPWFAWGVLPLLVAAVVIPMYPSRDVGIFTLATMVSFAILGLVMRPGGERRP